MDAGPQITVDIVLLGDEMWPIQTVLENTISVRAGEREEAVLLLSQCKERDMDSLCLKLGGVIKLCEDKGTRLLSAIRLRDDLTRENWRNLYRLSLDTQRRLEEILFSSVKNEPDKAVSTHVCSLLANFASIQVHNGWRITWPAKVIKFICESLLGNNSLSLHKRLLEIFSEWSRLVEVLLFSVGCEMKGNFEATMLRYLNEWNPTVSLAALEATVSYLPHLRRMGEEDVLCMMVAGIVSFLNGALDDGREESIQDGLDVLIVLANTRPELLMDGGDLYKCLLSISGKENVEGETLSKATDLVLVLAEKGEWSSYDLGVRLGELIAVFLQLLTVVEEEDDDDDDEESEAFDIGRDGLVRVAAVCGEQEMLTQAEVYDVEYGSAPCWEQRRAMVVAYDAIVEGCTNDKIMTFVGLKKVLAIALMYVKDKHPRVKVAALKLIRTLFTNSLQLYVQSKHEVHQRINEVMAETQDLQVQEVAGKVLSMYKRLVC